MYLGKPPAGVESLPRYRMQARPQPLPPGRLTSLEGRLAIAEDTLGVAPLVAALLEQHGAQTVILPRSWLDSPDLLRQGLDEPDLRNCASGGFICVPPTPNPR
uniref:Uncharacterized protein n=1 Tax=Desertifilum tharense IPPAS B-1220 TaxID=1781255 RepID=A0ACD5GSQ3_9CYAN